MVLALRQNSTARSSAMSPIVFFFQAEDGIRDLYVTGVQTCALPIWPALAGSILLFGAAILTVGFSATLAPAVAAIALSGIGNAVYSVMNQTALLEASDQAVHGAVMAARFAVAQAGKALGLGAGAVVTARLGARSGFAVIGVGLLAVGTTYALHLLRS